jgi:4-alpha-glucanotransferase
MPRRTISLILGCHSHQPVGNFEQVFQAAYDRAYRPFLDVLEHYPAVKFTQHYTGPLLDWFAAHAPDFLARLRRLVEAGQVEIMGGAYYEPLLCAIPTRDGLAQIERMNQFCAAHFGARPRGMWLAERVWEPYLPKILKQAGIAYTALDDAHFRSCGLTPEQMFGYYVTEHEGQSVNVFPILEKLRYLVPFHQVSECIDYLDSIATEDGTRCAVLHDDGEKFGVWPETHESVYHKGWLKEFFETLTEHQEWIHCTTYSEFTRRQPPLGRTYITCASYQEMMEWALPTPIQRRLKQVRKGLEQNPEANGDILLFVRGGFWRNFLSKYPEANAIQKKMLWVSERVDLARQNGHKGWQHAETLLHQAQCNCAYWHGVFGGLYLNHLRTAVYEKLIEAERLLDALERNGNAWVACYERDFDADGLPELFLENAVVKLGFAPADGGTLFEWDYKPKAFNLLNTLARRDEPYHDALRSGEVQVGAIGEGDQSIHELMRAKEHGLEHYLVYDPYRLASLRDHIWPHEPAVDALWARNQQELASLSAMAYTATRGKRFVELTVDAALAGEPGSEVRITKRVSLSARASAFEIRYDIKNIGTRPIDAYFGTELVINLLTGTAHDRYYWSEDCDLVEVRLGSRAADDGLQHLALRDDWQGLECSLRLDDPARVYRFGIETISQSEGGQERVYQGSAVVPAWPLVCGPGENIARRMVVAVTPSDRRRDPR